VFVDLMVGFTAVQHIATAHGLQTTVKVFEAFGKADSLAFLRPSRPPLKAGLCSVILDARGAAGEERRGRSSPPRATSSRRAARRALPFVNARSVPR
jgi:hypothetical protein